MNICTWTNIVRMIILCSWFKYTVLIDAMVGKIHKKSYYLCHNKHNHNTNNANIML